MDIGSQRPNMPTAQDEQRAIHQATRLSILMEDWDQVLNDWRLEHIGAERSQVWGVVDTSSNSLADMARQLSTPGLYSHRPKWRNSDPSAEGLTGEGGLLDEAGWSSKMAFVNYLTLGLGDYFVRWNVSSRGKFTAELVAPHDIYLVEDPENPGEPIELWRLRRRCLVPEDVWVYCWEVYDLGRVDANGDFVRPPSFRIHRAESGRRPDKASAATFSAGGLGEDLSARFIADPITGAMGALVGARYPWVSTDGFPVLPWAHYKDADTGQLWNTFTKRGAHRGALNSALYWTYAGHCARDATGSYVIVAGLHPGAISTIRGQGDGRNPITGAPAVQTKIIEPGAIDYHKIIDDNKPFVYEVGPGANLPDVLNFADRYEMKQATRWGLNPSDLSRTAANPSSAAALMVSNEGKREFSAQVEPVFRRCDLQGIKAAAIVARVGGLGTFPETGYSVQYHKIPPSVVEKKDQREELTWQKDAGLISQVDEFRALNDGTSEADAMISLVKVQVQEAELRRLIDEGLSAAGFDAEDTDDDTDETLSESE